MKYNKTFSIGNVVLINKVDDELNYFDNLFRGINSKAKSLASTAKLLVYNRLGKCISVNRFQDFYPEELYSKLKFNKIPSERTIYRDLSRIGRNYIFILENHQKVIKNENLNCDTNFIDFSSTYFEGRGSELGTLGYSRDNQPGKKQITFGISTGINEIPTALTIQEGNVQDKKHFRIMLKTASAVLPEKSLLIFDCGANTKENKMNVKAKGFHYLTLKPKKKGPYKEKINLFSKSEQISFEINEVNYKCVKQKNKDEINYIFFSDKLKENQLKLREKKFEKTLKKNKPILNKTKQGKVISKYISEEGNITTKGTLQKCLDQIPNLYITGLEGYFILESSIDVEPLRILALYKDKDKAEKLIRNMKEGTELRPVRHWSKYAIIGYLMVIFLANFLINLTLLRSPSKVINLKLLKKYLTNLTLTIVYPENRFRFQVISNISPEIQLLLGDFIDKYQDKNLNLRF